MIVSAGMIERERGKLCVWVKFNPYLCSHSLASIEELIGASLIVSVATVLLPRNRHGTPAVSA